MVALMRVNGTRTGVEETGVVHTVENGVEEITPV